MTFYTNPGDSYMYGNQDADPSLGTQIVTDLNAYNRSGGTEGIISLAPGQTPYFGFGDSAQNYNAGLMPNSGIFASADPAEIAAYKDHARTQALQGVAKVGALVGGTALAGHLAAAQEAAAAAQAGSSGLSWTPEVFEQALGGLYAPAAAGIPAGVEQIVVHGLRPAAAAWGPEVFAPLSNLYAAQGPPEPEIQGPPEPEKQTLLDRFKGVLSSSAVNKIKEYLKNPLIAGALGTGLGALLARERGSGRAPQKYPYYQAGGYDWRTGSFAPGKWLDEYPMANGGLVPLAGPNYPLGRVQAAGAGGYDALVSPYTGQERPTANFAQGGLASLGTYSDGGQLLRGPGDGVSDNIPAVIQGDQVQPARLADGEFVIPARIVSEIGNGSTEAGARKLYQIMDAIQRDRQGTVGAKNIAKDTNAERHFLNRK